MGHNHRTVFQSTPTVFQRINVTVFKMRYLSLFLALALIVALVSTSQAGDFRRCRDCPTNCKKRNRACFMGNESSDCPPNWKYKGPCKEAGQSAADASCVCCKYVGS